MRDTVVEKATSWYRDFSESQIIKEYTSNKTKSNDFYIADYTCIKL